MSLSRAFTEADSDLSRIGSCVMGLNGRFQGLPASSHDENSCQNDESADVSASHMCKSFSSGAL